MKNAMGRIAPLLALLIGMAAQGQSAAGTASQQPVVPTAGPYSWEWGPFTYDPSGNVAIIGNNYYVYDPMGRLVSWSMRRPDQAGAQTQTYGYDAYGNRTTVDGVTTYAVSASTNKLTGVSALYDAAGNLERWRPPGSAYDRTYTYDSLNMITNEVVAGHETVNVYTASEERLWRFDVTANVSHWTVRDPNGKVLRDFVDDPADGASWKLHREYIYRGGQLLAANTPDGTEHYSLDHLGSVRLVTDGSTNKKFHHHYLPFGGEWTVPSDPSDASTLRFTGHERDNDPVGQSAASVDYMHARFYNSTMARFFSADPVILASSVSFPQRWNRYTYVLNNPIRFTDPTGLDPTCHRVKDKDGKEKVICAETITVIRKAPPRSMLTLRFPYLLLALERRAKKANEGQPNKSTFTRSQCRSLFAVVQREADEGTQLAAARSSNTWGDFTIGQFNVDFNTRGNPTLSNGTMIDVDWFTDISSYTGNMSSAAPAAYVFGKSFWHAVGGTKGWPFQDPGEVAAVAYASRGASYNEIYNKACP